MPVPQQVLVNVFSLPEFPPVHPKCGVFSVAKLVAYFAKLQSAGNMVVLEQLATALEAVAAQPVQGAWHEFRPGLVGQTYIIPPQNLRGRDPFLLLKLGLCDCRHCETSRRAN